MSLCITCTDRVIDTVFVACGHAALCSPCAAKHALTKCPQCRVDSGCIRTYVAGFVDPDAVEDLERARADVAARREELERIKSRADECEALEKERKTLVSAVAEANAALAATERQSILRDIDELYATTTESAANTRCKDAAVATLATADGQRYRRLRSLDNVERPLFIRTFRLGRASGVYKLTRLMRVRKMSASQLEAIDGGGKNRYAEKRNKQPERVDITKVPVYEELA